MPVDTASILRILAHELRSPAGAAHGYLRLAAEGRLPDADLQPAMARAAEAVARIGILSRETSDLARWLARPAGARQDPLGGRSLIDAALTHAGRDSLDIAIDSLDDSALVRTSDADALGTAVGSLVAATVRESPQDRLTLHAGTRTTPDPHLVIVLALPSRIRALLEGPGAAGAGTISVERGGLGLTLVAAILVLEAHGARTWTRDGARGAFGLTLPLVTGLSS